MLRIGVIGCGVISGIYLKNLTARLQGAKVVACADLDKERSRQRAEEYGLAQMTVSELFYDGSTDNTWDATQRGFNHICMVADDIHAAARQITDAGYPLDREPKQGPDGNWQFWVTDPDGVRIEMMQIAADSPHGRVMAGKQPQ